MLHGATTFAPCDWPDDHDISHVGPAGKPYLHSCSTGQGSTFQISLAYWAIVRSLENLPE